jgi:hypothetical protein
MSSSTKGREATRRHRIARGLAPHVDPVWAEGFAIELRLLGVRGTLIGDALGEVDSHCEESEESAPEAFGDPAEYARSLQLPVPADTSPRALLRHVSPTVLQVLGMFMLLWGFTAWREGGQLEITSAHLVTVTVFVLGALALVRFAEPVLRSVVHYPVLLGVVVMASSAACALSFRFLDEVIWRVAAEWSLAVGASALIGGVVWTFARHSAHGSQDGAITSPLGKKGAHPGDVVPGPLLRLVSSPLLGTASISLWTLFLLAVTWWLTR